MPPIIDQIAEVIRQRLELTSNVESVVRPLRINIDSAGDLKITLTQGSRTGNPQLGYPGNPPVVAFNQIFLIHAELRPSEEDDTPIDTLRNEMVSAIRTALTAEPDWYRWGDLAINSEIGAARKVATDSGAGVVVELLVQYRHAETNDTEPK